MKKLFNFKLLVLFGVMVMSINTAWAADPTTIYVAVGENHTHYGGDCRKFYSRIKTGGDRWELKELTQTAYTYNGKTVYSCTHYFDDGGYNNWYFCVKYNDQATDEFKKLEWYAGSWKTDLHAGEVWDYDGTSTSESNWKTAVWDQSYNIYFVNIWDWPGTVKAHAYTGYCDYNAAGYGTAMTSTGMKYNNHDIYRITLTKGWQNVMFSASDNDSYRAGYADDVYCFANAGKMFVPGTGWINPTATSGYTFSNGATVVWDNGSRTDVLGETHLYYEDWEGDHDILLDVNPSINQHYYTAPKEIKGKNWIMRGANAWGYGQTTDITENISNYTLFQYDGSADSNSKVNWQVTHNAKKGTSGTKIYFDNTDAKWSAIWLRYGTQWYTRCSPSSASKVAGTDNLYVVAMPNDAYYGEYLLADNCGYTEYSNIESAGGDSYLINNRTAFIADNLNSEITYIPSSGAGTPKVWTASTMSGHTHDVTISAPSHGTITVAYTNESGSPQSPTSGTFAVARTCSLTVSSSAATGYEPSTLTINSANHNSGDVYIIKGDITVAATFSPKSCTVTFDKNGGEDGDDNVTATYDAAMTTVTVPSKKGYTFDGYYDGETDGNGSGTKYYNANGTSAKFWDKDTKDETTLHAKWIEITHTVSFANDGHGTTSPSVDTEAGEVTGVAIDASNSTGYSFNTWTITSGSGSFASAATTASNTFKPAEDATLTASFTANTYTSTDNIEGGDGSDGTYTATYDATSIAINTAPALSGYDVEGYYTESTLNNKIATPNNNGTATLTKDFVRAETRYTDTDGKWVYQGAPTLYAKWSPKSYILKLYRNDGTEVYSSITVTMGSSTCVPDITAPTRAGYDFLGFYTAESGGTKVINTDCSKPTTSYFNSSAQWIHAGDVDLYAHWDEVDLTFDNNSGAGDGSWSTASNWSPACVPTVEHDVTISAETTISGSAVAKSVTIGDGGKVTIQPTGVLEVAGTVTNTDDSKLIINTNSSNQGALIYDISKSSPSATINMTMNYTGSDNFQYIASPVGGARVSSMFSGKGVYTYAWIEGKGWERRGYYDDFMGNEVIVINGQGSCIFSGLLYPSTGGSLAYTATPEDESAQGVNMIPNTLTAPIKIAAMSFSGSSDNGVHIWQNGAWRDYAPASSAAADAVIPALQGYAVLASGSGSVSFEYDAAVRNASSHNVPLGAPKRVAEGTPEYMTISVMTNDRKVDLQLSEHAQFTTAIDKGWETIYMEGDGRFGQLYALADEKMSILASPDLEGTVLGFVPGETLNYTLSFEGDGKGYYLNDIEEQQSTLIEEGNTYTFSSGNNNAARFIISRTPINKIATGVDAVSDGVKARKQMSDGVLYIIRDGKIFDARGNRVK